MKDDPFLWLPPLIFSHNEACTETWRSDESLKSRYGDMVI